jgi:endonuclease YncB( thermonuclease family)
VSFDLFLIRTWDGNDRFGADVWDLSVAGGPTLLHTTFSNVDFTSGQDRQAYPDPFPGGDHPGRTGAVENNSLGYTFNFSGIGIRQVDSVYQLSFTFPHSANSLVLNFTADPNQEITDESWGLDNVEVRVTSTPLTSVRVIGVEDGDTLLLASPVGDCAIPQIRLVGVDTPELLEVVVDSTKDVEKWCVRRNRQDVPGMAREAAGFVRNWLGNPRLESPVEVDLELPEGQLCDGADQRGRLLAYVYRRGERGDIARSLNAELLRRGYALAFLEEWYKNMVFPNIRSDYAAYFMQVHEQAQSNRVGFWGAYRPRFFMDWQGLAGLGSWPERCSLALLSPSDSSDGLPITPTLRWMPVQVAASYQVKVGQVREAGHTYDQEIDFATVIVERSVTTTSVQISPPLRDNMRHWWQVIARRTDGTEIKSAVYSFTVGSRGRGLVPSATWKASTPWPGDFSGPRDPSGRIWHALNFDDASWQNISLPDNDSFPGGTDRFYRATFNLDSLPQELKVFFASDDGIWLYVNGNFLGHWGADWRDFGCVNNPLGRCGTTVSVAPVSIPSTFLNAGKNVLAVRVSNGGFNSYFDLVWLTTLHEREPNDTPDSAQRIPIPVAVDGFAVPGDSTARWYFDLNGNNAFDPGIDDLIEDFYRIDVNQRTLVTITLAAPSSTTTDLDLYLFTTGLTFVTRSAESGTPPEQIVADLEAGSYLIIVTNYDPGPTIPSPYTLTITR